MSNVAEVVLGFAFTVVGAAASPHFLRGFDEKLTFQRFPQIRNWKRLGKNYGSTLNQAAHGWAFSNESCFLFSSIWTTGQLSSRSSFSRKSGTAGSA